MHNFDFRNKVNIDSDKHKHYLRFASREASKSEKIFLSMKDMFMAAAVVGWRNQTPKPVHNRRSIFAWEQFNNQIDVPLIKALALVKAEQPNVLVNRDQMLTILEEYANGGIDFLVSVLERPGGPMQSLLELAVSDN